MTGEKSPVIATSTGTASMNMCARLAAPQRRKCDMSLTPTERKKLQRQRDKALGYVETTVRVPKRDLDLVRRFVAALLPPDPVTDPDQLDLLDRIEQEIASDKASPEVP